MAHQKTQQFWVETPWRSWGLVLGKTAAEARANAKKDKKATIAMLERQIESVRRAKIKVQSGWS